MRIQIKGILALSIALTATAIGAPNNGVFKDSRDGKTYKTVKIGKQVWMAENLNYKMEGSYCYKNDETYCENYGRLYEWEAAMKACPEGWHLPTKEEFETLMSNVGGKKVAGKMLKSTTGWYKDGHGVDMYGFNVLPAGTRIDGSKFRFLGLDALFWGATEGIMHAHYYLRLKCDYEGAYLDSSRENEAGSVRCVKD